MKDWGLLILRAGTGLLMLPHGFSKLMRLIEQGADGFANPLGLGSLVTLLLAILIEFIGSMLLILGVSTKIIAGISAAMMLVASLVVLSGTSLSNREPALLFFLLYLALTIMGGGRFVLVKSMR